MKPTKPAKKKMLSGMLIMEVDTDMTITTMITVTMETMDDMTITDTTNGYQRSHHRVLKQSSK